MPGTQRTDKTPVELHNLIRSGIEREMAAIHDVHFGIRHVAAMRVRLRRKRVDFEQARRQEAMDEKGIKT